MFQLHSRPLRCSSPILGLVIALVTHEEAIRVSGRVRGGGLAADCRWSWYVLDLGLWRRTEEVGYGLLFLLRGLRRHDGLAYIATIVILFWTVQGPLMVR